MIALNFENYLNSLNNCNEAQEGNDSLKVVGMVSRFEPQILYNVCSLFSNEGIVVEIGSWVGAITIAICLALKKRYSYPKWQLLSIDPLSKEHCIAYDRSLGAFFDRHPGFDLNQKFNENISKWDIVEYVNICRIKSIDLPKILIDTLINNISVLWIDSDHIEETLLHELNIYVPMVMSNGFVILHDKNNAGVSRAVSRYLQENKNVLIDDSDRILASGIDRANIAKDWVYIFKKI